MFDTKIKIALKEDIPTWQQLNVTAFLISGIGGTQNIVGEEYKDASGNKYLPMSKQPIMIHKGSSEELSSILKKANNRDDFAIAIFTEELFYTYNDEDNRESVSKFLENDLNLMGIAVRGKKNQVDKVFKNIKLFE